MKMTHPLKNVLLGLSSALVIFLFSSCSSTRDFKAWVADADMVSQIDSICNLQMQNAHFPGMAVAIASGNRMIWSKGYGFSNLEKKEEVDTKDDLFRIGSISKTVTGSAMARLYERREINLDIPISNYYKDCPKNICNLTLRQISGHLAGIRHYRGFEFLSNIHYDNVIDPLEVFIHDTLLCLPGEKFSYSTYAWTLVSAVMQMTEQKTFTDIIAEEVKMPLHITDLKPDYKDSTSFQRVSFYIFEDGTHRPAPEVDNSNKWAGGGFLCSAEDLARFGFAFVAPGYLKEETITKFTQSQTTNDGVKTNNGIGFFSGADGKGRAWFGHGGGSAGGTSMLKIYPEQDLVIVTLVNMSSAQMDDLATRIGDIVLDQKKK